MRTTKLIRYCVAALAMVASASLAQNYLYNGGFDIPAAGLTSPNYPVTFIGSGGGPMSSADGWHLYNGSAGTTSTELLPSADPLGSGYMLHLNTSALGNGIYQTFPVVSGVGFAVDAYVLGGSVVVDAYGPGFTHLGQVTENTVGQWSTLTLLGMNSVSEITIRSAGASGAEFYLDMASLTPVPEPSTLSLWAAAAVLIPVLRRTRKSKG